MNDQFITCCNEEMQFVEYIFEFDYLDPITGPIYKTIGEKFKCKICGNEYEK